MTPRIRSGDEVIIAPWFGGAEPNEGDIVLVKVNGRVYLHLVDLVDYRGRVRIANNHGHVNGWTGFDQIYGICVAVNSTPRY